MTKIIMLAIYVVVAGFLMQYGTTNFEKIALFYLSLMTMIVVREYLDEAL